jgi:tRNA nucleotidyltransferase/poly(A) polymerase
MSDYTYMLESHLSPEQNRVVAEIRAAASQANVGLFLAGGAMRDMLAGFRIRDLDFVVEGNGLKLARAMAEGTGAGLIAADEVRKSAEMVFGGGVTAQVASARQERAARPGVRAQAAAATIQDDLRGRDFTCNAIALSLNRASRGLLLDPLNGLADIERRELRAASTYGFYDDPSRLLRLVRFQVRLGFRIEDRTKMQVANAREAEVEKAIPPRALGEELRRIAAEDSPAEILLGLEKAGLSTLFCPALTGPKLNPDGLAQWEKCASLLREDPSPDAMPSRAYRFEPFLYALGAELSPKERQSLIKRCALTESEGEVWTELDARAKKLETALRSARISKPSQIYRIVNPAPADTILHLLYRSTAKPVQERLHAYFQDCLPALQEISPAEWAEVEGEPGTPKYQKAREEFIAMRLDRRPPKPPEPAGDAADAASASAPPPAQPAVGVDTEARRAR